MGIKRAFSTLCGVKQQEDKQDRKYTFHTNTQKLTKTTLFILEQIFHNTRVSLRVSVIKGH